MWVSERESVFVVPLAGRVRQVTVTTAQYTPPEAEFKLNAVGCAVDQMVADTRENVP